MRRLPAALLLLALAAPASAQVHREDDAHVSGHYGSLFFCVRQDTATALAAAGDYIPCIVDATGHLWTRAVQSGTWTVTANAGSGTFAIQATAASPAAVRLSDGAAFYDAAKTGQLPSALVSGRLDVNVGAFGSGLQPLTDTQLRASAVVVDQAAAAEADYDTGAGTVNQTMLGLALPASGGPVAGGTASNPVRVDPTGSTAQPVTDNAGSLTVDGTVAATQSGTWTVQPGNTANTTPWLVRPHDGTDGVSITAAGRMEVTCDNCGGSGGTAQADESGFTEGTTSFTPVGGVLNDTITSDPTEDQAAAARITPKRALHVNLRDASGNELAVGGGTQYAEDTATAAGEQLTMAGVVRDDTPASIVDADGDRTALQVDGTGRLWVNGSGVTQPISAASLPLPTGAATAANQLSDGHNVTVDNASGAAAVNIQDGGNVITVDGTVTVTDGAGALNVIVDSSALPTGASTLAEQQTQTTSLQKLDNVAHSGSDVALAEHVPISGQLDETGTTTVTENQIAPLRITSGRALHVAQQGSVTVVDGGGAITVDGTVAVSSLPALVAGTANIGDVDVLTVPAPLSTTGGGTEAAALRVTLATDSTGLVSVDDGGGALTVDGTVNIGTFPDNEPFNVAQVAGTATAVNNGTASAGTQRVTIASDSTGQVKVLGQNSTTPIYCTEHAFLNMTTATTTEIVALTASQVVYVCSYAIHVGGATDVKFVSGTGTNCGTGQADESANFDFGAADAGINRGGSGGSIVLKNDAGEALCVTSSSAVDVDVEVSYAKFQP